MEMPDDSTCDPAAKAAARRGVGGVRLLGQGSNNFVFAGDGIVVKLSKPHREAGALGEYRKEAWCSGAARARGVRTPEVLEFGTLEGRAFQIQEFVAGHAPAAAEAASTWRALGDAARRINGIAVEGWGGSMAADGVFAESWAQHLAYNIASLTDADPLIARGVLDAASSAQLRAAFERLAAGSFRFALCHADLALWNTLIDAEGQVWLLDWGCAVAHVVPHHEFNEIARGARPDAAMMGAFLEGYGMSRTEYDALRPERRALSALREVDTLRWALEKSPGDVAEMSQRARTAVERAGR